MSRFVEVARTADVPEQCAIGVNVEGKRIALFNIDGDFYALDDTCSHRGGPLSEGTVNGEQVVCPWHGAHFNIKTGEVTLPPARKDLTRYKVRVKGDAIEIEVQ